LKIAITADCHLSPYKDHPERFRALDNILYFMLRYNIETIVILGDLFNEDSRNYSEFDRFCKNPKYKNIKFYIIPGNHDSQLNSKLIASENVKILSEPEVIKFDLLSLPFLFMPYKKNKTMGEEIAPFANNLSSNEWVLIGHGDWVVGMREINPREPGVYMPLTRTDIETYKPVQVVLGHIHKQVDLSIIHYPGSPCPLDISETGRRRFLIIDTENGFLRSRTLEKVPIHFNETLIVLPLEDETAYLNSQINKRLKEWNVTEEERSRVRIRIKVKGYTLDKRKMVETIKQGFHGYRFYKNEDPDISEVSVSDMFEQSEIIKRVIKEINQLKWNWEEHEPDRTQILIEALHAIYGE
jgi:DNA repair exonuclease SbcCD nuclease subunit